MARPKYPKIKDLVRQGVDPDDLDEMHYNEEEQCRSTRIIAEDVDGNKKSFKASRKRKSNHNRAVLSAQKRCIESRPDSE